ncbi:hypothetical protein ABZ686_10765 [Streptomyces sp. NPDC006992]|uniref:hypothetical protein n=1 Tax=Streptomyces sp. NPDC006992 TaxID=3155601 RepID=UPI0033C71098
MTTTKTALDRQRVEADEANNLFIPTDAVCTRCNRPIARAEDAQRHVPDRPSGGGMVFYSHKGPCPGRLS